MKNTVKFWGIVVIATVMVFGMTSCSSPPEPLPETFIVTFNSNGGTTDANPQTRVVNDGAFVTAPDSNPRREDYEFGGWYKELSCVNEWNFDTDKVTSDITLYAKWNLILPTNITELTENIFAVGSFTISSSEQWYKFTATASTQYIHYFPDLSNVLSSAVVQMYDSIGNAVGSQTTMDNETRLISLTVTSGQEYYVKVSMVIPGTFQIGFNSGTTPPLPKQGVTTLTANTWASDSFTTSIRERWYKFTATASTQLIHYSPGSLTGNIQVQVYDSIGNAVGSNEILSSSSRQISLTVTNGQEYYVSIHMFSSNLTGTFQITFNTTVAPPGFTTLAEDTWDSGNISSGELWYKFTATASTQYIHFSPGSATNLSIQVYDLSGNAVAGSQTTMSSEIRRISRTVTSGQEYYIRVRQSVGTGTFQIAFGSLAPPGSTLTAHNWHYGDLTSSNSVLWYKFTATASTQYIHFSPGSAGSVLIRVYNSNGNALGTQTLLQSAYNTTSQTVTSGQDYYIAVSTSQSAYGGGVTGTFNIAFGSIAPPGFRTLSEENTWVAGTLTSSGHDNAQWYKFTATASTQYIHFVPNSLTSVNIQVYDSNSSGILGITTLSSPTQQTPLTVTIGQEYYVRVYSFSSTGTFQITFGSTALPGLTLTENTWASGSITSTIIEQWYKFTATAGTQYIHFSPDSTPTGFGGLGYVSVQVYNSSGNTVGSRETLSSSTRQFSRTVTIGQEYYVQVRKISTNGTFRLGFNNGTIAPTR